MINFFLTLNGQTQPVGTEFDFSLDNDSDGEVLQCVAMLFLTPIGTVVFDRVIGIDYRFIDRPQPLAIAMVLSEIPGKIELYEPRVKVEDVKFTATRTEAVSGKVNCSFILVRAS